MIVRIFGPGVNDDDNIKNYRMFKKLINKLRSDYLADGGDFGGFPEYLASNGIRCVGLLAFIDERWDTYAALID